MAFKGKKNMIMRRERGRLLVLVLEPGDLEKKGEMSAFKGEETEVKWETCFVQSVLDFAAAETFLNFTRLCLTLLDFTRFDWTLLDLT